MWFPVQQYKHQLNCGVSFQQISQPWCNGVSQQRLSLGRSHSDISPQASSTDACQCKGHRRFLAVWKCSSQLPSHGRVTWHGQLYLSLGPQFPHCRMWMRLLLTNLSSERQGNSSTFTRCPAHCVQKTHWAGRKQWRDISYLGYNPSHI